MWRACGRGFDSPRLHQTPQQNQWPTLKQLFDVGHFFGLFRGAWSTFWSTFPAPPPSAIQGPSPNLAPPQAPNFLSMLRRCTSLVMCGRVMVRAYRAIKSGGGAKNGDRGNRFHKSAGTPVPAWVAAQWQKVIFWLCRSNQVTVMEGYISENIFPIRSTAYKKITF